MFIKHCNFVFLALRVQSQLEPLNTLPRQQRAGSGRGQCAVLKPKNARKKKTGFEWAWFKRAGVGGANAAGTSPGVVEALLLSAVMGAAEKGWGFISDYLFCHFFQVSSP